MVVKEKFEGPYVVKKVWSNGLSYLSECVDERGNVSEIRAHHNQLRKWREPPEYLSIHPMNEWLRENRVIEEDDKEFWEGKQLVLIEKRQRSKSKSRKKDISKEVDKHNATKELQEYRNGMTYSICRFSLDSQKSEPIEIEQVEPGRVTINQEVGQVEATSRIASGRESVEVGQIANSRERQELDSFLRNLLTDSSIRSFNYSGFEAEDIQRYRDLREEALRMEQIEKVGILEQSKQGKSENIRVYEGPITRSRGPVPEYEWVMRKGV